MKNKRSAKILSLVLALVMVFSLFPVSAYAATRNNETGITSSWSLGSMWDLWNGWWNRGKQNTYPAQDLTSDAIDGMTVSVEAPEGALPKGTTMDVVKVENMDAVQAAVDKAADVDGIVLAAVDITFMNGGKEVQPKSDITVTITSDEIAQVENPVVVHLDTSAEELESSNVTAEPVEDVQAEADAVTFDADKFSIYAVIGEDQGGDNARVTVNFHRTDDTIATMYVKNSDTAAEIEKIVFDPGCGDVQNGYLFAGWTTDEQYDENTPRLTIEQIRSGLETMDIKEGKTIDYFPIILKVWTITYFGNNENVSLGSEVVLVSKNTDKAPYKVNMSFGTDGAHHFEGWHIRDGRSNIVSATYGGESVTIDSNTLLVNGTDLEIKGSIKLSVYAPEGHWLVFNENGKGATYNAPRFLETNEVTEKPCDDDEMLRNGYDFGGWYTDAACTEGNEFDFGHKITETTNVYAKWTPKTNAPYTVVVWTENAEGDGWDFAKSIPLTGTTNTTINVVSQDGATVTDATDSYHNYKVNGEELAYLGFHADHYDHDKTIAPEGNTVVNVYYKRNQVKFIFNTLNYTEVSNPNYSSGTPYFVLYNDQYCQVRSDGTFYAPITGAPDTSKHYWYYSSQYGWLEFEYVTFNNGSFWVFTNPDTGGYVRFTDVDVTESFCELKPVSGEEYTAVGTSTYNLDTSKTYYVYYDGAYRQMRYVTSNGSTSGYSRAWRVYYSYSWYSYTDYQIYFGTIYELTNNSYTVYTSTWAEYKTMTGRYGTTLADNNEEWPEEYAWHAIGNPDGTVGDTHTTFLDEFLPASTSMVINFYGDTPSGNLHIYFYKQNAAGTGYDLANTVTSGGGTFYLSDKYTGFKLAKYHLEDEADKTPGPLTEDENGNLYYDTDTEKDGVQGVTYDKNLYIYFDRLSYKITYFDGVYVDGNNNVITDVDKISQGFGTSDLITYGADISAYGDKNDTEHYKVPTRTDGYVFEGWFADDSCSTLYDFDKMPLGGVTVYAKWRQIQYRVYLHPNVPSTDTTLDWGDADKPEDQKQSTCFRVSYNGKVSAPEGLRANFWMNGWYTDPNCTAASLFNADLFALNETTVTTPYDRETEFTDTYDKFGELIDSGSAKDSSSQANRFWITKKLDLYASWRAKLNGAEGIGLVYDLNGGSGNVSDSLLYQDQSFAIAQGAPTSAPNENLQFLYWEVWTVENYENEDSPFVQRTDTIVYPGGDFRVLKTDAQCHNTGNVDGDNNPLYTYTVKLVAKYGPKQGVTPTHITWYSNLFDVNGNAMNPDLFTKNDSTYTDKGFKDNQGHYVNDPELFINQAVDIEPATLFSYPGYKFIGWARVNDVDDETAPGNPASITRDDMFLEYRDGKFYAKSSETATTFDMEVSQVAADERHPYHDLYALWEPEYFYVLHSSTGELQAVEMPHNATGTFDLRTVVNDGTLYGGYYTTFNGVTPENVEAAKANALSNANHLQAVKDAIPYTADTTYVTGKGFTKWWVGAQTADGTALVPQAGSVYNLKEVPAKYLTSRIQYVYNWRQNYQINQIYLMTVVDDKNYTDVGFELTADNIKYATLTGSFTFVQKDTEIKTTTRPTDFTGVKRGFVGYADGGFPTTDGFVGANVQFTMTPFWITPDHVKVTGAARTFTTGDLGTKDTIHEVTNP